MKSFSHRSSSLVNSIVKNRKVLVRKGLSLKLDSVISACIGKLEYAYGSPMTSYKSAKVFIHQFDNIVTVAPGFGAKNYDSIQNELYCLRNEAESIIKASQL